MPADRPLRNLARDILLDVYANLQGDSADKKYNLRKELPSDKRNNVVYANRWLTRDQYLEMVTAEIAFRGIDLPANEAATPAAEAVSAAEAEPAEASEPKAGEAKEEPVATT